MKFNHESESITKAFGIEMSSSELADKITDVIKIWFESKDSSKMSKLAERLHEELPYEVILFLATQEVHGKFRETMSDMESILDSLLKSILRKTDDDKAKMN